ncbi:MAG: LamG domain-containing protein, partial [Chloroflexota bacterium]|nr:LamG domain-containing protein [Chloroflexota bacterium]
SSIDSDYQVFLNLTPETLTSLNGQIMLYKYNYQGWGEKLNTDNIGLLDHSLLTALKSIVSTNGSSPLSVEITDYIDSPGEISFALGVLDPNDQLSFFSKEKMVTDGVDIYVTAGDLLGPSGNGSGYAPQTEVWPSISFVKKN